MQRDFERNVYARKGIPWTDFKGLRDEPSSINELMVNESATRKTFRANAGTVNGEISISTEPYRSVYLVPSAGSDLSHNCNGFLRTLGTTGEGSRGDAS